MDGILDFNCYSLGGTKNLKNFTPTQLWTFFKLIYFQLFSIVMVSIPKNWCAKNVFCHLKILYLFENISISNMKMNIKSVSNVTKKPGQDLSTIFALNPNPICAKCASKLLIVFASTEYICAPTQVRHRTLAVYEVAGK